MKLLTRKKPFWICSSSLICFAISSTHTTRALVLLWGFLISHITIRGVCAISPLFVSYISTRTFTAVLVETQNFCD
jgi:hypothetical protein